MNGSSNKLNPLKGHTRPGTFLAAYLCLTGLLIPAALLLSPDALFAIFDRPPPSDRQTLLHLIFAAYFSLMSVMNARRLRDGGYSGFIAYFVLATCFIETIVLQSGYSLWFFAGFSFCLVFVPHVEDLSRHTDVFK